MSPGLDGVFGTADDKQVNFIPERQAGRRPDRAVQRLDHLLRPVLRPWPRPRDQGRQGTVFIPLQPDDPLYVPGSPTNFMVLTRATNSCPGPDGILGTADDIHDNENTTTPFVDQNQTYYVASVASGVPARLSELDASGHPVATGKLITNRDLGADGHFGTGRRRSKSAAWRPGRW